MALAVDPVDLTAALVRCASVTPRAGEALDLVQAQLETAGFTCVRVPRGDVDNLFARFGPKGHPRSLGFNGHVDVVPIGDTAAWTVDPFGAEIRDGLLWGRGATDMKSGVAAFVSAAVETVSSKPLDGAVILTITGDEEGPARDGTAALLDWMAEEGEAMTVCLVGEPTCPEVMGEAIKVGRRGSLNATFTARGVQGHVAYPERARNPVSALAELAHTLATYRLDDGTAHFDPSSLALTSLDTGNPTRNVIPAQASLLANIRFNTEHSGASLTDWLTSTADRIGRTHGLKIVTEVSVSGEAFLTEPSPFVDLVSASVEAVTGRRPVLSTSGGTSDARFIKDHCPVVEVGLVGRTMHQVDERVSVQHVQDLTRIYHRILTDWFA